MPYSTNTKNDEFGHAQVLRDLEHLYLYIAGRYGLGAGDGNIQSESDGYSQEVGDDALAGRSLLDAIERAQRTADRALGVPSEYAMTIGKGNLLATYGSSSTKVYGLKYSASSITSIPTSVLESNNTPKVTSDVWESYPDGLCYAYLYGTGAPVFVATLATPASGAAQQDSAFIYAPEAAIIYAKRYVLIPKQGDASTSLRVYLTWLG